MLTFPNITNFQAMFAWMNRLKHVELVFLMSNLIPLNQLNEGLRFFLCVTAKVVIHVTFFNLNHTLVNATQLSVGMGYTLM